MVPFVAVALLGALASKFTDFLRYASGKDWAAVTHQAITWIGGVVVTILFAKSDFASSIILGSGSNAYELGKMSIATLVIVGMSAGSIFSVAVDFQKAFDNTGSSKRPDIGTNSTPTPPDAPPGR
jgi:hypothetical protein